MTRGKSAWVIGILAVAAAGCSLSDISNTRLPSVNFEPNSYVVQVGDTIESVAYRYQLTSDELAALNPGMRSIIYPGDRLFVRSGRRDLSRSLAQREAQKVVPASYRSSEPYQSSGNGQSEVVVTKVPVRDEALVFDLPRNDSGNDTGNNTSAERLTVTAPDSFSPWQWPGAGEVVREFSPGEVSGQGIDIAGVPGQEIKSAADGTVIYAGRDLSNSGNLVIVRHSENLLSTYSHVDQLYVAEDDKIRAGDPLASLGSNKNQESVLHFGIRENGKPVDPRGFLPAR